MSGRDDQAEHGRNHRALYDAACAVWPELSVELATFSAFLDQRAGASPASLDRAADLLLVCACLRGDDKATEIFATTFGCDLERAAARVRAAGISAEDSRQTLLRKILVGSEDRAPKLASYSGSGSLRNWVKAVAARAAVDLHRKSGDRETLAAEALLDQLTDGADPEITYLKRHYRDQFKRAFEAAVASLSPRSRNYLRHLFVDQLTIDQVAALYGIHRSTAARRLAAARDALLTSTRAGLLGQLAIDEVELDSIMRLIGSQLDVSIGRIFERAPNDRDGNDDDDDDDDARDRK